MNTTRQYVTEVLAAVSRGNKPTAQRTYLYRICNKVKIKQVSLCEIPVSKALEIRTCSSLTTNIPARQPQLMRLLQILRRFTIVRIRSSHLLLSNRTSLRANSGFNTRGSATPPWFAPHISSQSFAQHSVTGKTPPSTCLQRFYSFRLNLRTGNPQK